MAEIKIRPNGQTLRVNASVSHWTTAALAVTASGTNDVESTTTTTITADYSMHFANTATTAVITVTQLDGTTLYTGTLDVNPGVGLRVLNPAPDMYQTGADDAPRGLTRKFVSGYYYGPPFAGLGVSAFGTGTLYLVPFWVASSFTADRIGVEPTATNATSVTRLGIFGVDGNDHPSTLLLDAGTVDSSAASGTGGALATISHAFTPGLYYLGAVAQVADAQLRYAQLSLPPVAVSVAPFANAVQNVFYKTGVTGALASLTSITGGASGGPQILVRAA